MKKKTMIIASVLAVGLIGAAGYKASATQEKVNPIVKRDAIKIIEEKHDGHVTDVDFEYDDGKPKYEIDYKKDGEFFEVDIDATSGEILKEERKGKYHHDSDDNRDDNDDTTVKANKTETSNSKIITTQKAIEIALQKHAGQVTDVELDDDEDRLIYEIEIETNKGEVDIDVDAVTGKILKVEFDD